MTRLGLLAIALVSACDWAPAYCEGDWAAVPPEQAPPVASERVVAQVLPAESKAIDMLFVIDDSMSMTDEQEQLGKWSSELFNMLSMSGELPDLHIAVTSSSVAIPELAQCPTGTGSFHTGAAVLQETKYLRDIASSTGRLRNYAGTLTETFAKMAKVGDHGCGFEQPFKAARLALSGKTPGSEGFLRDDALLLVVFVTDEDDCSSKSPALYAEPQADACSDLGVITSYRCFEHGVQCYDGKGSRELGERRDCRADETSPYMESVAGFAHALKKLKANPAQVVVAGIYGKPNGVRAIRDERVTSVETPRLANVCGGGGKEGTGATPAVRMNALMAEFGGRASHSSICDGELAWAMRGVGVITRAAATRDHCLRGELRDVDAATPGLQPACRVEAGGVAVPFTIDHDPACAETETQLAVRVEGIATDTLTVTCAVDAIEKPPAAGEFQNEY